MIGNTDEMLVWPESLEAFASQSSAPPALWERVRQIASATRSMLGAERLAWLQNLPKAKIELLFALVHATPDTCWQAPAAEATDAELERVYGPLGRPIVIFGHTHMPFARMLSGQLKTLINTGSVGLPYDGDPRASYLLLDGKTPSIRRIEYNVEKELKDLAASGLPGAEWTARMLRTSSPQIP